MPALPPTTTIHHSLFTHTLLHSLFPSTVAPSPQVVNRQTWKDLYLLAVSYSSTVHISSPQRRRMVPSTIERAQFASSTWRPVWSSSLPPGVCGTTSSCGTVRRRGAVRSILNDDYLHHVTPSSAFARAGLKSRLIPGRLILCLFFPCLLTPSPARFQRPLVNILLTVMLVETCNPYAPRARVYRRLTICSQAARRHPDP
jgi:hypothetical protein